MADPILTVEELDTMWPTDATSESDYEAHLTRIEGSLRELRNKRTRVKTPEDALDAYDGLVADASKTRELGLDAQVSALKAIGRTETGNTQWNFPANFSNANWLIADHEGAQMMRNRVLEAEYGWTLEGYEAEIAEKEQAINSIEVECKQRVIDDMQRKIDELQGVEGDD